MFQPEAWAPDSSFAGILQRVESSGRGAPAWGCLGAQEAGEEVQFPARWALTGFSKGSGETRASAAMGPRLTAPGSKGLGWSLGPAA